LSKVDLLANINDIETCGDVTKKRTVSFYTLGCRLNKAETGTFTKQFIDNGFSVVDFEESADVVLINTCVVTDKAESVCRNVIRRARKISPDGYIVVVGCYAEIEGQNISKDVDLIIKASEKHKIFYYLDKCEEKHSLLQVFGPIKEKVATVSENALNTTFFHAASSIENGNTRAFLKIQDGCNFFCSYCIIPYARGRSRGADIETVCTQARELISSGFKEIVLTGINIGDYRSVDGDKISRLPHLLRAVLSLNGLERLRLSSIEPNTITDELLDVVCDAPNFMNHFHIPLQSGDDEILRLMGRKYTLVDYTNVIKKIIDRIPNVTIGTDVIVGHPGETEEHFVQTKNFLQDIAVSHFHIFPYSLRKGTKSAQMPNQIEKRIKKMRARELIELGHLKLKARLIEEVSAQRIFQVLFEQQVSSGVWEGYTSNYLRVRVRPKQASISLKNEIRDVVIISVGEDLYLEGEIIADK